jgi:RNA-binding protein
MAKLSNSQRKYLRGLAHALRPTVMIGKQGLSEQVVDKIDQELNAHELIKLKFLEFHDEKEQLSEEIASRTTSTLVSLVGFTAVFYRQHPDWEQRTIALPAA